MRSTAVHKRNCPNRGREEWLAQDEAQLRALSKNGRLRMWQMAAACASNCKMQHQLQQVQCRQQQRRRRQQQHPGQRRGCLSCSSRPRRVAATGGRDFQALSSSHMTVSSPSTSSPSSSSPSSL